MKKRILILTTFFFANLTVFGQTVSMTDTTGSFDEIMDSLWSNVDMNQLTTPFLKERGLYFTDPVQYHGNNIDSTNRTQPYKFQTLYTQFSQVDDGTSGLPMWDSLDVSAYATAKQLPLFIFNADFNQLKEGALDSSYLYYQGNQFFDTSSSTNPFEQKTCYAASFAQTRIDTHSFSVVIPTEFIFNMTLKSIASVVVDFKDELGYRSVGFDQPVTVSYDPNFTGWKDIDIQISYADGSVKYMGTSLHIIGFYANPFLGGGNFPAGEFWPDFTSENTFQGHKASANVTVAYGCGHTKLTKPLIIFGGIDPTQLPQIGDALRNFGTIALPQNFENENYESFRLWLVNNASGLYDDIQEEGYDLVYVDYNNGADFIQRNGELARSVIKEVNRIKTLNGGTEKNVVLGVSMGGLVARWALTTMENASEVHDVSKFITFDTPHNGAYTPVGFQMLLHHVAEFSASKNKRIREQVEFIDLLVQVFENPAARQLLKRNIFHSQGIPVRFLNAVSNPDHTSFLTEMDNLGYPQNCEFFAIANGSANMDLQKNASPNMSMLAASGSQNFIVPLTTRFRGTVVRFGTAVTNLATNLQINALPNSSQGIRQVYNGAIAFSVQGLIIKTSGKVASMTDLVSLETVPGGNVDLNDFNNTANNGINVTVPDAHMCFVPTVSSLALKPAIRNNFFYNINGNYNPTTQAWTNNESEVQDFQAATPATSGGQTVFNEFHTEWSPQNGAFMQSAEVGVIPSLRLTGNFLNNQTFNFGKSANNETSKKINSGNLIILNNGVLAINKNSAIGLQPNGQQNPTAASTFRINTGSANCNPVDIDVEAQGSVEIGDNTTNNIGVLTLTSGTSLEIRDNGTLRIANHSKLVIEAGALLQIHPNANIILEGEEAKIEVHGSIELMGSTAFNFTKGTAAKAGFVHIYTNENGGNAIVGGGTPSINVVGNNKLTDVLFVVEGGDWNIPLHFSTFSLTEGSVELLANARIKLFCPVDVDLCQIKGLNTSPFTSIGLETYGQANVSFESNLFIYLKKGLNALNNVSGNAPTLITNHFTQCKTGLYYESVNGSLIDDCSFYSSECGMKTELFDNLEIKNSTFKNNTINGLDLLNAFTTTTNHVFLDNNDFENNLVGLNNISSTLDINVTLKCNRFLTNTKGIFNTGNLNLSPTLHYNKVGGDNTFYNNSNTAIRLDNYCKLYLDNGNNNFINTTGVTPYNFVTGYVDFSLINPVNNSLAANGNYWDPSTTSLGTAGGNYYSLQTYPNYGFHPVPVILEGTMLSSTNLACYTPPGSGSSSGGGGSNDLVITSTKEIETALDVTLYPNPAQSILYIDVKSIRSEGLIIKLFDLKGKLLLQKDATLAKGYYMVDIASLAKGVYIIKVEAGAKQFVQRVIKNE